MSDDFDPARVVDGLIRLLTVEQVGDDSFVGAPQKDGIGRVFGGQVIAQALQAAQVDPDVEPSPMRQHSPDVPPGLEAVVLKCLAKAVDSRYPSLSLVVRDLEALI